MTEVDLPKLGDVVVSKNGRFRSELFVVLGLEDGYAWVANGKQRKVVNPKKKKIKHLEMGSGHSDHIREKIEKGEKVTNNEVRITLRAVETNNE